MREGASSAAVNGDRVSARRSPVQALVLVCVFLVTAVTTLLALQDAVENIVMHDDPLVPLRHMYWMLYAGIVSPSPGTALFYAGLPLLLLLQWLRPAKPGSALFGTGMLCDLCWMLLHGWMVATLIGTFLVVSHHWLEPLAEPVRLGVMAHVPAWMEILLGYLLIELLGWFSHLLRHKVPVLWVFHEVHHSQREMNPFTLFRVHPIDYLMAEVIILLPSVLFEETLGIVLAYLTVSRLHDALTHSNIRTNLGWLRFVFVTPQSHRVHHSIEPEYFDMNFGVTLSIWDRLFGTHSPSDFVYPSTGIPDEKFPLEKGRTLARIPAVLLDQLVYPVAKAARRFWTSGERQKSAEARR